MFEKLSDFINNVERIEIRATNPDGTPDKVMLGKVFEQMGDRYEIDVRDDKRGTFVVLRKK